MIRTRWTTLPLLALLLAPDLARPQAAADPKPPATAATPAAPAAQPVPPAPPVAAPALPAVLSKFNLSIYGYVNVDAFYDTSRSFAEGMGSNTAPARPHTQNGENARFVLTARNSRFGFRVAAPEYQGMKASALIETDFGQMYGSAPEGTYYPQGLLRLRQANMKVESPVVDVLIGQSTYLYGWQSSFFPATAAMLGIAGQPFGRTPQIRLTKILKSAPVNVEIAAGAFRPPQRDAAMPEIQGGLRLLVNEWKGTHTLGGGGTAAYPAAIAVSGSYRQLRGSFAATATPTAEVPEKTVDGTALSVDALIPIIPSRNGNKGNTLTLVGTYAITSAAGDLLGGTNGVVTAANVATDISAAPPAGTQFNGPDVGNVAFDANQKLHAVRWRGVVVGADYYLPPSGRVFVSATFSQAYSDNVTDWAQASKLTGLWKRMTHYDANLFFDLTPAVRLVGSWQRREARYGDGVKADVDRYHFSAYYFF